MKYEPVVGVQPEVIRWARVTIGLSQADVARRLKRTVEEIEAWETGASFPTYPQLEKLAYQVLKRPLAVFFLPSPPDEPMPEREFRTLPDVDLRTLDPDTYLKIRRAHAYQLALSELFNQQNPNQRRIWNEITLSASASVVNQAAAIRAYLAVSIDEQVAWKSDDLALKMWRRKIEEAGVFIFKSPFKQKDVSGFCLRNEQFPIVYLNNSTAKTRQIFSLLHELAHLLFSLNGLSKFDQRYIERLPDNIRQVEKFCNAIAAEILIPIADFQEQAKKFPANIERASEQLFSGLAERYGVSREAILRRFLDQGRVNAAFYEKKAKEWAAQKKKGDGGNWYASQNVYLSERFAQEVISRHYRQQISIEQASELLGIKPANFAGLEQRILQGSAA